MVNTIKLTKYRSTSGDSPVEFGLKVEAQTTHGDISNKIFVWQSRHGTDEFVCVASPGDLTEIPEDEPDLEGGMPYYRTDDVELWFRNFKDFEFYSERINDKVRLLVSAYNHLQNYETPETVII